MAVDIPSIQLPGVNRCLPLAVCNGVTELHDNLRKVLEKLDLGRIKFYLAGDLKLINSLLGLSGTCCDVPCSCTIHVMYLNNANSAPDSCTIAQVIMEPSPVLIVRAR